MSWKYFVGRTWTRVRDRLLASPLFPLTTAVPFGTVWPYDVARFAGTRRLSVLFDVGANVGQTALHLRGFFPQAEIHAFEPVPSTHARLAAAVRNHPRILPRALGLSERAGTALVRLADNSECNAVVGADYAGETCSVTLDTLDHYCAEHGLAAIDILKIDVEGHELSVLNGARRMLAEHRIRCIYAEVTFAANDPHHTPFSAVSAVLTEHNFHFAGLYQPWRYPAERHRIGFADALFWNPAFVPART